MLGHKRPDMVSTEVLENRYSNMKCSLFSVTAILYLQSDTGKTEDKYAHLLEAKMER